MAIAMPGTQYGGSQRDDGSEPPSRRIGEVDDTL